MTPGGTLGRGPAEELLIEEPALGLSAVLVLDDMTLGPAAGGIRTWSYASLDEARTDARRLARTMTIKCALAGLDAGGGKLVVMDSPRLKRDAAFAYLGRRIQELGGRFHTAGDLGTRPEDLAQLATQTSYVHRSEEGLEEALGAGAVACMRVCAQVFGASSLRGVRVLIQGCGTVGAAVARAAVDAGADVILADLDVERAGALAQELHAGVCAADELFEQSVDIIAPCAVGGVVTPAIAERLMAKALCGAANHVLSSPEAEHVLRRRAVLYMPDFLASAGAVVQGMGRAVMGLNDCSELLQQLARTAARILELSLNSGALASDVAETEADARIRRVRTERRR